jgi:nucleotidyltransferase substrate binding protein (TIGR01987 family)
MSGPRQNEPKDIRWRQRFQNFRKALARLTEGCDLAGLRDLSDLEQQGLIQAFEFTHELAWNTLKDFLEHHGATGIYGSRDATREAFSKELIADGETWMEMIKSRNRSSHTYEESIANEIAAAIVSQYWPAFKKLETRLVELEKTGQ